jgi:uncharacterized protein (TIGR03086 family)
MPRSPEERANGSDVVELYRRASEEFRLRVRSVEPKDWHRPTPCSEWDVRALVHHVVEEERWVPPLLGGATIEEIEGRLSGDLLGADPPSSVERAAEEAERAVADLRPPEGKVHLSYGEEEPEEYLRQVLADHVVHAWDLAAAVDGDKQFDPVLITAVAEWFAAREEMYRASGIISARAQSPSEDPQNRLLAAFGRDPSWAPPAS